jgi:hypothetical protein
MQTIDGLQRMLDFLDMLREKGIHFWIEQQATDELMVTFTLVGARVEATFSVEGMNYSVFEGSEDVDGDPQRLERLIAERWGDQS